VETLDLDPAGYTGTYKLIGGRLALDFINTISWPGLDREHDWLSTIANVKRWATAVGLDARQIRSGDLEPIRTTRCVMTGLIRPLTHDKIPAQSAVVAFNAELSAASSRRVLHHSPVEWTWQNQSPREVLLDPIIVNAADIAATHNRSRLGHCPSCDWVFYDETRNGARRWCDMADCGSRAKSRRYYQRTTT